MHPFCQKPQDAAEHLHPCVQAFKPIIDLTCHRGNQATALLHWTHPADCIIHLQTPLPLCPLPPPPPPLWRFHHQNAAATHRCQEMLACCCCVHSGRIVSMRIMDRLCLTMLSRPMCVPSAVSCTACSYTVLAMAVEYLELLSLLTCREWACWARIQREREPRSRGHTLGDLPSAPPSPSLRPAATPI